MAKTSEIVRFLEQNLDMSIPDFGVNGLQVQGPEETGKIILGVDACMELFEKALAAGAGLVVVHHGIFWGRDQKPVTGILYNRISFLIRNHIVLFAVHLPLDHHPAWGHNALLLKTLGLEPEAADANEVEWGGPVGVFDQPMDRETLAGLLEERLGTEIQLWPFGPRQIKRMMVVSGSGLSALDRALELGCDAFLTGEMRHSSYYDARETGINVFFGGHFVTESIGMQNLAGVLSDRFQIPAEFISLPTGL